MKITGNVEFMHLRNTNTTFDFVEGRFYKYPFKSLAVTLAFVVEVDKIIVGVARTNMCDQFVKRTGRTIAEDNLNKYSGALQESNFVVLLPDINAVLVELGVFDKTITDPVTTFNVNFGHLTPFVIRNIIARTLVLNYKEVTKIKRVTGNE